MIILQILFLIPIITGCGLAAQSALNARLSKTVKSPYLSSLISFTVGLLLLLITALVTRQSLILTKGDFTNNPWWIWIGGILGLLGMTAFIILFPILGSVQTSVLTIFGQILMGVLIDQFGWLYSPQKSLTWLRFLGVVLMIAGVLLANLEHRAPMDKGKQPKIKHRLFWQIIAILTGVVMAVQSSINGHLGTVLHSSLFAVIVSFTVSLFFLILFLLLSRAHWSNLKAIVPALHVHWWLILGGLLGILFSLSTAWLVPILGTGEVVVFSLFGQLLFSTLIDQFGLFESKKKAITRQKIIGLILLFVGVLLLN